MKIAIIAFGHADNVITLSHNLSRLADVTLIFVAAGKRFTRSIFDWDISKLPFGLTTDVHLTNRYIGDNVLSYITPELKVYIARTPSRSIVKDWGKKNLKCIKEITDFVRKNDFDVVHFNGFSGFQIYFHWLLRQMPKVYTIHDYLPHSGEWRITPVILHKLYTKLNYQFIQHYEFLSREFSNSYGIHSERVNTVYCGSFDIYRSFVHKTVHEEPKTILYFGRISPYKGLKYLVKAFSKIKKNIPDARLIIAGKGNFYVDVGNTNGLEVHNRYIPNDELVGLIQRASIVVAPYTDATHSAVIMTAYAFNKPVVASAVGGIPEVVEDGVTGKLVPPKNAQLLADAIIDLLKNSGKRKEMKVNIEKKRSIGKLSWDYIARQTIKVYTKAIRQGR